MGVQVAGNPAAAVQVHDCRSSFGQAKSSIDPNGYISCRAGDSAVDHMHTGIPRAAPRRIAARRSATDSGWPSLRMPRRSDRTSMA